MALVPIMALEAELVLPALQSELHCSNHLSRRFRKDNFGPKNSARSQKNDPVSNFKELQSYLWSHQAPFFAEKKNPFKFVETI